MYNINCYDIHIHVHAVFITYLTINWNCWQHRNMKWYQLVFLLPPSPAVTSVFVSVEFIW